MGHNSLANQFLIAMPSLADPNFVHSVTYICEHTEEGAMGIVINRPTDVTLREVLKHMEIEPDAGLELDIPVLLGGPVQPEHGFVLHTPAGDWGSSMQVTGEIAVTTSQDILSAIARGRGPEQFVVALGYAGWSAGQLEQEIADNAWLSGPADPDILFQSPFDRRWPSAAALLGVDLTLLSSDVGHA